MSAINSPDKIRECHEPFWLHQVFTYLLELFLWVLATLFWGIWLKVDGRIPRHGGVLVLATHRTLIDWAIIGSLQPLWLMLFQPWLALWFVPERKNFMFTRFLTWTMNHSKCIPVDRDNKYSVRSWYRRIWALTKAGYRVCLFPTAGRESINQPLSVHPGIGKLVHGLDSKVQVVALRINGLPLWNGERMHGTVRQKVAQFAATIRQVFSLQFQVQISILDLDDLRQQPDSEEVLKTIAQRIADAVHPLYPPNPAEN